MNNIPLGAKYYYQRTYYKTGWHYALYFAKGSWRQSASVTNEALALNGVKIYQAAIKKPS